MNYPELLSHSLTKRDISSVTDRIVNMVTDGEISPLEMHARLAFAEKVIKEVKTNPEYRDAILAEAEKYGKTFSEKGCTFQIKESGIKYDYSNCDYPPYKQILKDIETLDKSKKETEYFLKKIPHTGTTIIDEETGEVLKIYPPSKSSNTTVQVTIQK